MGLFKSSKKVTNTQTTNNRTVQAASEDGPAFAVESGGAVTFNETDHGSISEAIKLATDSNRRIEELATRGIETAASVADRSQATTRAVLQNSAGQITAALGALQENNRSTEERGLSSIVMIAGIAALAFAGPKIVEAFG